MPKKPKASPPAPAAGKPSALVDARVIYCGDNLTQLRKIPDASVDLIYIDPPSNSNRNYEVFWGETREKRAFADRHASTQAYIDFMRPRCVELALGPLGRAIADTILFSWFRKTGPPAQGRNRYCVPNGPNGPRDGA